MIEKKAKLEDNDVFVEDNHSDVVRMQREEDNTEDSIKDNNCQR